LYMAWRRPDASNAAAIYVRSFTFDLIRGGVGFLLIVPPALYLQSMLILWIPYEHPTTALLKENQSLDILIPQIWLTAIVTPVVEETFFRGLILGWFERLLCGEPRASELFFGTRGGSEHDPGRSFVQRWGAILGSAVVFALMHLGNGPDHAPFGPDILPLFLLAIGLGWITRQSGRITPAIVIHVLLNGNTIAVLLWGSTST